MATISSQKAAGVYYTPPAVVSYIVDQTLQRLAEDTPAGGPLPRIFDPACGDGAFLVEACDWLLRRQRPMASEARIRLLQRQLFGIDVDAQAVQAARRRLIRHALAGDPSRATGTHGSLEVAHLANRLAGNVACGDTLRSDVPRSDAFRGNVPQGHAAVDRALDQPGAAGLPGTFDAIIGNPPYINIRVLAARHGAAVNRYYRERYLCARGAYDVYVLFLERAFELLREGGVCGMIVPNKLATLNYAATCRALLVERTTLHEVSDLADARVFADADVYPYIVIWQKRTPPPAHEVAVRIVRRSCDLLSEERPVRVRQRSLGECDGWRLHGRLDVESRVATLPLAEYGKLSVGTSGFSAARLAAALVEHDERGEQAGFEFIVSGNIDRYAIHSGNVRFLRRRFVRPVLPVDCDQLSDARRQLFHGAKIVLAGMSRRLEAAFDPGGCALGVQVYALAGMHEDPRYLLALLNSRLLTYLFRTRYQAKRLSGGYLAINKSQLARLPIRRIDASDARAVGLRSDLVRLVEPLIADKTTGGAIRLDTDRDRAIDERVAALYGLRADEIQQLEAAIAGERAAFAP